MSEDEQSTVKGLRPSELDRSASEFFDEFVWEDSDRKPENTSAGEFLSQLDDD